MRATNPFKARRDQARQEGAGTDGGVKTALESQLSEEQRGWLEHYVPTIYDRYDQSLFSWRRKMQRYEDRMNEDFDDRVTSNSPWQAVFTKSNESLNVVGGFADFMFTQAREDIFGTRPWFKATAVQGADVERSKLVTKHSTWKLEQSNCQDAYETAAEIAAHMGTAHVKQAWLRDENRYWKKKEILVDGSWPVVLNTGEYVEIDDDLEFSEEQAEDPETGTPGVSQGWRSNKDPQTIIPETAKFEERLVEETVIAYDNVRASCVHFSDICWNEVSADLDLLETDVFHRFQMGLLDAAELYQLTDEQTEELRGVTFVGEKTGLRQPRVSLSENDVEEKLMDDTGRENSPVILVEGYMRMDIFEDGSPVKVFVVFSPFTRLIYRIDYLANVTPGGQLPIKPVRVYRQPQRAYGRGFHERFEKVNDYIDANFNAATYSNRMKRVPMTGVNKEAVFDRLDEGGGIKLDENKLWSLKPGQTMKDFISYALMESGDDISIELAGMMIEMAQLRTGISSAAQGEMSSLPQANTATGIKSLMSRAATLLKWPIDKLRDDLTDATRFAIYLIYANHRRAEMFTWSEGATEVQLSTEALLELPMNNPAGVFDFDLKIELSLDQEEDAINSTAAATNILERYRMVPELEKANERQLYVQSLRALGFEDAETIVREPIYDVQTMLAQLPLDVQPQIMAELGIDMAAPEGEESAQGEGQQMAEAV